MTVINQPTAIRRFHQGLNYLLSTTNQGAEKVDSESFLAAVASMPYLGAYAFPDDNLYQLQQKLRAALDPVKAGLISRRSLRRRPHWLRSFGVRGPSLVPRMD